MQPPDHRSEYGLCREKSLSTPNTKFLLIEIRTFLDSYFAFKILSNGALITGDE